MAFLYLLVGKGIKRQIAGGPKCWCNNEHQQVMWPDGRAPKSNTSHQALLPPMPCCSQALSLIRNTQKIRHLSHSDYLDSLVSRTLLGV